MIDTFDRGGRTYQIRIPDGATHSEIASLPCRALNLLERATARGLQITREGAHGFRFRSPRVNVLVARGALDLIRSAELGA